ncbi:23S rRNA (pseudouridine(1915)-N(3))-methyltransferase RlmH [Parvularcula sp. LCG005]|uniref:23S rRNA (pseudouridine(1915)-N(3))-methyltransferase RlmH n=1 Tax=Parvularcula sp. LCG005 TaxID=3078805 RepID=UPI00294265AD|nr:23S rRNA (pseudouridine(1915)-N(3))-methyltransferase RlmH [Parvularcula sp. LCG005]WOI54823.1 23S rRNA (pseudouridine(1915)-N(3))-methyltransferase RlmH [Parvularcula sp. LCG005]
MGPGNLHDGYDQRFCAADRRLWRRVGGLRLFGLHLAVVGKDARSPHSLLTDQYLGRAQDLARGLGIDGPSLSVVEAPRALSGVARQDKEAWLLLNAVPQQGPVVVLDEAGKNLSSREIAALIEQRRDQGAPAMTFFIGGADGFVSDFQDRLAGRPVTKIAFGRATWPHMLVRAMIAEQLYRAMTLLTGHPYHRD